MMLLQINEPSSSINPESNAPVLGIDFGTTHCVLSYVQDGKPTVIHHADSALIPSVISWTNDRYAVGHDDHYHMPIGSIKRMIGKTMHELNHGKTIPMIGQSDAHGMIVLTHPDGTCPRSLLDLAIAMFRHLKSVAQTHIPDIERAVITVPAYFDDNARNFIKDAARIAGFNVLRLIAEPTAAALAYGLDHGLEGYYAIYDIGGGTFDFSLLNMTEGVFQVIATGGDSALGGDDMDELLLQYITKNAEHPLAHGQPPSHVMKNIRMAKESLSTEKVAHIPWGDSCITITRDDYESLIDPIVQHTLTIVSKTLQDADHHPKDIKGIVMVGGATRTPLIQNRIAHFFGQPPLIDLNPDEIVAMGAAIHGATLAGEDGTILVDVTPLSLGLETMGGIVEKIIPRNTPIPVSKTQEFTTYEDGQTGIIIHVLQGEREMVHQCRSLGRFELTNLPPAPAGIPRIRVTFSLDTDGLLTVSACDTATGHDQKIEIHPHYGLHPTDIERMIMESQSIGKHDIADRLLATQRLKAHDLIKIVEKAMAQDGDVLNHNEKNNILKTIEELRIVADRQDRSIIQEKINILEKSTEKFAEKRVRRALEKE